MKTKKKLTAAQKRLKKQARLERQKKYEWIFLNGKQVRVKRAETIEGMSVEDYITENADDIWLHQNGRWDLLDAGYSKQAIEDVDSGEAEHSADDLPF